MSNNQMQVDNQFVQEIFFPDDLSLSDLYIRQPEGYAEFRDGVIRMKEGARISTNTYFNSFYEDYWRKNTDLDSIELELFFKGHVWVEIFRDTADAGCVKIEWMQFMSLSRQRKRMKLPSPPVLGQSGRIFIDIVAASDSELYSGEFRTEKGPERDIRLTVGICTFNREKYLYGNLRKLTDFANAQELISKIIVVNQGAEFSDPMLRELIAANPAIQCVDQSNLGGCGGFTRTMYEALKDKASNYHVVMDDDVHIDPRIFRNLHALLGFLKDEIVIGGHMLDLMRPWILHEAGAMINQNTRITPLHTNIDLRAGNSLIPFNSSAVVDYNAWWFCAIPKKYILEADFPAPIFIRGDDIEFGQRLGKLGVPTVSMPGIAVWHEPFYVKAGGWQTYYDFRNRFILASAYPERFRLETPSFMLLVMMKALAVHDYQEGALIQEAIQDFLKGPSLFDEESSSAIHERITTLNKRFQPASADKTKNYRWPKLHKTPKGKFIRTIFILRRLLSVLLKGQQGKDAGIIYLDKDVHIGNIGPNAYVKTNGIKSYYLKYSPDRGSLKYLLRKCLSAYLRYRSLSGETAKKWNQEIPRYRKEEWWGRIFSND